MNTFQLPTSKLPPEDKNPKVLLIYSIPKAGKTEALAQLNDCLILDFERGTKSISATALNIIGLSPPSMESQEKKTNRYNYKDDKGINRPQLFLSEAIGALKENNPYKYIALDTITQYEDMCIYDATVSYMKSSIGKNFNRYDEEDFRLSGGKKAIGILKPKSEWDNVLNLPRGAGYSWLRESYQKYIDEIKSLNKRVILSAHIKTSMLTKKDGKDVEAKDLNLTGKIKDMTAALIADSIGYIYREGNKNFISFESSDEVKCGSRSPHLSGKTLLLSEKLDDGSIKTYWENIYK